MFKIPFIRNEGKWHEVNCSAENIPLSAIRQLNKKAKAYLEKTWSITTVEGMYFLTEENIESIPSTEGYCEIKNLWEILKQKTVLYERHFKKLKKLRESNNRYSGIQKRALLGIALIEPLLKKNQLKAVLRGVPGFESASPGKKKIILAA